MTVPVFRSEAGAVGSQRTGVSHSRPGQLGLLPGWTPAGRDRGRTGRVFIDWKHPAPVLRHCIMY